MLPPPQPDQYRPRRCLGNVSHQVIHVLRPYFVGKR
jgi:hypothetical protein